MGLQGKKTTIFKLKGLRVQNNYTQEEMAEKLNISKATYARKENGVSGFNSFEITEILNIFGVRYEEIFC